jgi:Domain of unknown function (DUF5679)
VKAPHEPNARRRPEAGRLETVRPGGRRWRTPSTRKEPSVPKYIAYCVKCKEKREFEGQEVEMKNGRKAGRGQCPVCGTTLNRILGNK